MENITVERLNVSQVADFIANKKGVVIDTLVPEHYEARHIPGAVSACVYEMVFLDGVAGVVSGKDTPIVVYGAGEGSFDCEAAADKLGRAGYTDVAIFPGGLGEWLESGRKLEGGACDELEPPHQALSLDTKVYSVDTSASVINWTGRNNNGGHSGNLRLSSGELDVTGEPSAVFTIDMTSIKNTDLEGDELQPVLEAHLKSDDFFFTKLFPEAKFETTAIKLVEDGEATRPNAMIQGSLSMRGVSNEIAFPAHIRNVEDGKITVMANLDFDRTQWGIIYGSSRFFKHLGYHVVFDFISIDFRLVLA